MNSGRKAFTLMELLVVVGILGILTGLVLGSLCEAKARSRRIVCTSNLHQLGLALNLYVDDFHKYPVLGQWTAVALPCYSNQTITPYTAGVLDVFFCPSAERPQCPSVSAMDGYDFTFRREVSRHASVRGLSAHQISFRPISYGYNSRGSARHFQPGLGFGWHLGQRVHEMQVKVPCEMIALGDSGNKIRWDMELNPNSIATDSSQNLTTANSWLPSRRHQGGANIVFCDAHVEYDKQARWIEEAPQPRRRWNKDHEPHPETW